MISMHLPGSQRLTRIFAGTMLFVTCFLNRAGAQLSNAQTRPRIIITADPELDDNNSLIRFLLYSSDVDVEGLIYASSGYHWKGDGKGTKWFVPGREYSRFGLDTCPCASWRWAKGERFIDEVVDAYAKSYINLKTHHPGYPTPAYLRSTIRYGNIDFDGDISKNSPGSDLIRSLMLDDKPGPLFITAWGGHSTIARALKSIQEQYEFTTQWSAIKAKISHKVILLPSADQDDTYATYIQPNWGDIEYRQFVGGPNYGYGAQIRAKEADAIYLSAAWTKENVSSRGALGELYRIWGDGKQMVKGDKMDFFGISGYTDAQLKQMGYAVWMPVQEKGSWISEGDNGTFMNMLDNGLRAFEKGSYSGWGGSQTSGQERQAVAAAPGATSDQSNRTKNSEPDFFPAVQRDFAARLKWSVTPKFSDANHAPSVVIEGPVNVLVSPGETILLNGSVSDKDKNSVEVKWWQFYVGTYSGKVEIANPDVLGTNITIPKDAVAGQTIHIILEATDNGSPALTRYQRVIITVKK